MIGSLAYLLAIVGAVSPSLLGALAATMGSPAALAAGYVA